VALSRRHSPLHEAQLNLALLQPLGQTTTMELPAIAPLVQLRAAEPLARPWQELLQNRQPDQLNVILHPRSRGSAREWGLANFGQLARLLHQAGHRVFVTGTAAEGEELGPWLTEHAPYLAANLTGQLSLPQFWPLLPPPMGWWRAAPARCTWRRRWGAMPWACTRPSGPCTPAAGLPWVPTPTSWCSTNPIVTTAAPGPPPAPASAPSSQS
jgi:hypothetical protein